MAMDITGIKNENEFYTHHYLSAILENDLKDIFSLWKQKEDEEGVPQPYIKLRGLRKDFFNRLSLLERERNVKERLNIQREFISQLISVLGYEYHCQTVELDDNGFIPLSGGINRSDGSPELWVIEAANIDEEDVDPLELHFLKEQYPDDEDIQKLLDIPMEEIITRQVFGRSEPPRWVILINTTQLLLLDRTKWHEKKLLRFNIREILDRRETSTLQAMAALLHRDSICPKDGMPLLDTLDENSHKHAFAVSEDLKYSLRKAIELLGNEAVWYLREKLHEKIYGRDMAGQLTRECLRYMYRMLFLFYIEARPELEYLPDKKSKEYHKGYSLESLRDLEMVQLTTDESKNGFYFHESISLLFDLLYNGFQPKQKDMFGSPDHHTFNIEPLRSHLFDQKQTPLLNRVKFRNYVMQEIIELMSLSRPKKGKRNRRGRISYAQLGINQLGAVYEALLSYQGFFAETDLYEVKKAGENYNELETAYFVKPEDIEQYTEDERVFNDDGTLVKYEKGKFIYRLAGRDREKSASYYTPEVLTQCLVKYALKELLKDKTADEILELTVCEPAMGSAAFLNEAVNQLAKAYLDKKTKEIDQTISHEDFPKELQKVKMYIADRNVHGVDLNPVAVELAEVSLWLNTIYEGAFVPWFGMQLVCGNSLIGARRQVFRSSLLKKSKNADPLWLDEVPERVMPGEKRPEDTVYHFLLPDRGMADYKDKVVKSMAAEEIKTINEWRKEFTKPFSKSEIEQLKKLSSAVDKLWERHIKMQKEVDSRTTDPLYVFGQKKPDENLQLTTTGHKDRILQQEMLSKDVRNSSPYRRLKLVMDYWCALWFWPIEKANLLPSRAEYILDLTLVLEGNLYDAEKTDDAGQMKLFPDTRPKQMSLDMVDEFGFVDVDRLCRENDRFALVQEIADSYHYLHWELEFADLFESRGGFDLVLGNPPWIKIEWNEGGVMGDVQPLYEIRKMSASELARLRDEVVNKFQMQKTYFDKYIEADATQNYLNSYRNYYYLKGTQCNLYKCFLPQGWMLCNENGVSAFLHPESVFDDPNGGILREQIYSRLCFHFQFQNQLMFFPIPHRQRYSINISINNLSDYFLSISNLFHPSTIDKSFEGITDITIPAIKDKEGNWDLRGHPERIIRVDLNMLTLFARLYDIEGTPPLQARFPAIHSVQLVNALRSFAKYPKRLNDYSSEYMITEMWHETNAQTDGTIRRETKFPNDIDGLVVSGPHFFVGNPLYKSPRHICTEKAHYDVINLEMISKDYLPRTNYTSNCSIEEYRQRIPKQRWNKLQPVTDLFRVIARKMLPPPNERTLITAIFPKKVSHIHGCIGLVFSNYNLMFRIAPALLSIPFDFFIKVTGKTNLQDDLIRQFPALKAKSALIIRTLMLNCLSEAYEELWNENWNDCFQKECWGKCDPRLKDDKFSRLLPVWNKRYPLKTDYERRQALIEIDVLVSLALRLSLKELKTIYRVQFPVLNQNEADTWYDQNGRIVFTASKGLPGIGLPRKASKTEPIGWEDIKDMKSGTVERSIIDDTMPGGPVERTITYEAPFDRCDREKDYEVVWAEFERRFGP